MTIVLLVLGGLGALYTAASLFQLPASFTMMAAALELENFSLPDSVRTISIVGALLVFAVYALNLVYAVQRVRSRRLAFWVPLVAAVVAGIVMFVFAGIAVTQVPDLMQATSDPDAFSKLLEFAANPPSE